MSAGWSDSRTDFRAWELEVQGWSVISDAHPVPHTGSLVRGLLAGAVIELCGLGALVLIVLIAGAL